MKQQNSQYTDPRHIVDLVEAGILTPTTALMRLSQLERNLVAPVLKEEPKEETLSEIMDELDQLIGLQQVKLLVREIKAFIEIQQRRQLEGLVCKNLVLHMIFKGNPGTGKTTVARILGKTFRQMNVLSKGHLVEVERADLVGEYIGHTAQRTREQVKKALGGILFIDEAYSLARGGEKDFGKEAIDTLVKAMEDHKSELILILAGYHEEMDRFLRTNPGLRSRFPLHIEFPDYSPTELMEIAKLMLKEREYELTDGAMARLWHYVQEINEQPISGNARAVRNLIERAIRRQAVRLVHQEHITRQDLILILPEDLDEAVAQ